MAILHARDSLRGRMRMAQTVLVVLMLIPALVAITLMITHARDYHNVIEHMSEISTVQPIIENELLDEIIDIVTGRKLYEEGEQFAILDRAQRHLDRLIESNAASRVELEVARRLLGTLHHHVLSLGESGSVDTQMQRNEVINDVAYLFLDMLQNATNTEISAAAERSEQIQRSIRTALFLEAALLLVSLAFAAVTQSSLSKAIRVPLSRLEGLAGRIAGGELSVRVQGAEVRELAALTDSLNAMAFRLERLMEENRLEQENLKRSELRTLQAQITPHFLYNTLDAIVWLAEEGKTEQVIEITGALSDFFRISLNNGKDFVTISEEWEHLRGYLTIQQIRYRDIFRYELDIDETLARQQMLKLLIQPLVENALYHGIKNRRGGGVIRVTVREADGRLEVCVSDSGVGIAPGQLARLREALSAPLSAQAELGYGLYSVDKRIKLYYDQPNGLTIESREGEGTTVRFAVPIRS